MLKKLIRKAKSANDSVAKMSGFATQLNRIQQAIEPFQQQLTQLQHSVNLLESQQDWLRKKALVQAIHTYPNDPEPAFSGVTSQVCTFQQMHHPNYIRWCKEIEKSDFLKNLFPDKKDKSLTEAPHRKIWEFCYILQALEEKQLIRAGSTGLGFGVGLEPLPALFASYGCKITATDMALDQAIEKGWADESYLVQHSQQLDDLNKDGICEPEQFGENCRFRFVDMNHIPEDLRNFDFTWSACCLEHLGSIEAGLQFIKNSLKCLKSGGIAVHTTEFNLSSEVETVDHQDTVLFRKSDILRLVAALEAEGHTVSPVTFNAGTYVADEFVDLPPYYKHSFHLKLLLGEYVTTSIGIIIQKK